MSKTFLKDIEPYTLIRSFSILLNCQICHNKTQIDPLSNYNFGPCCSTCYVAITRKYNEWVIQNDLEKNSESEQRYISIVKDALGKH
jgi:hypothetical protein